MSRSTPSDPFYVPPCTIEEIDLALHRLKLKRPPTAKMYRDVLDEMYAGGLEVQEESKVKAKL